MKKKIIFILLAFFVVLSISIIGIKSFNTKKVKQNDISIIQEEKENKNDNKEKTDDISNESNQEELKKSETQEKTNSKNEKVVENKNEKDSSTSDKKTTTSVTKSSTTTTSTNTNSNNNSNSNSSNENKTVVETPKQDPVVKEEKPQVSVEQPKTTNSYVGVPNPNDFYYSFHKGHIDKNYTTLDGCYSRTAEVSLIDTVDVINTTCFEVLDGQGTVLGIYMYVKCHSGNCERYKTLVGIETN